MADYAKRPEVTVSTMGKVHNPSGEGVRPLSSQVHAKATKVAEQIASTTNGGETNGSHNNHTHGDTSSSLYDTKVKEGTAKRNIVRKKTADKDSGNFNSVHKKYGGHGKSQWQDSMMDPSYVQEIPIDEKDPIYDEAEDLERYILVSSSAGMIHGSGGAGGATTTTTTGTNGTAVVDKRGYDPATSRAIYGPLLTLCEFKVQLLECIKEYFDSCDTDEVIRTLQELGCQEYHPEIVKKAVSLAMDLGPRERELTSRLLTCLHPTPMSLDELQAGFVILLDSMEDLSKDVPDAKTMAAAFVARAVVDEVLSPAFLSEQNNDRPGDNVVEKAVALLNREHCNARLERVWGPGDGRPVEELKKDMDQLLQEYLLSRELDEAARCVKELDAPHFHHELIKRGVFIAMEADGVTVDNNNHTESTTVVEAPSNIDAMAALFGFLVRNAIISDNQVKKGVDRLHKLLPDLTLDVPAAPTLLMTFEKMAREKGCLGTYADMPN